MIGLEIDQNGAVGVLKIEGAITIESAAELKETLLKALENTDNLCLHVEAVSAVDISCFQLLCSAHRTAIRMKKGLTWAYRPHETFRKAAQAAGYAQNIICAHNINKSCLWLNGC